ncbi:hypothetical protein CLAIMM_09842 [Cladophialophora immunda]|nr:hypothetical protein CLAIMM_09842 [Cladophialophora immunda]
MFFSSPTSNITPAMTSVAMSRSDSRDSTSSNTYSYAPTSAYTALVCASPTSAWPTSQALARTDSNASNSTSSSQTQSIAMRRDSSNSTWMPSPYRSCMSSFGAEPSSYLSDDDLLCSAEDLSLPVETIPALAPKKELTTEEQIAFLRELQEKELPPIYPRQQLPTHETPRRNAELCASPTRTPTAQASHADPAPVPSRDVRPANDVARVA